MRVDQQPFDWRNRQEWVLIAVLVLVIGVIVATAFLFPSSASGATRDPRVTTLQRQVTSLNAQVKQLRTQIQHEHDYTVCMYALTRDSDRGYYHIIAEIVGLMFNTPPVADLPRFEDGGACDRVGITRPTGVTGSPPALLRSASHG